MRKKLKDWRDRLIDMVEKLRKLKSLSLIWKKPCLGSFKNMITLVLKF